MMPAFMLQPSSKIFDMNKKNKTCEQCFRLVPSLLKERPKKKTLVIVLVKAVLITASVFLRQPDITFSKRGILWQTNTTT
jgi:hypothetical protein